MDSDTKKQCLTAISDYTIQELAEAIFEQADYILALERRIDDNTQIFHREIAKIIKYLPKGYVINLMEKDNVA